MNDSLVQVVDIHELSVNYDFFPGCDVMSNEFGNAAYHRPMMTLVQLIAANLTLSFDKFINPRRMREGYGTCSVINPRRMREGYGTWFVVHSLINPRRMREGYGTWFVVHSLINPRRMREGYGTCFVIRSLTLGACARVTVLALSFVH